MHMNANERFEFDSFDFGEVCGGDFDEHLKQLEEPLIGALHNLLVGLGQVERVLGLLGPDELDAEQAYLSHIACFELHQIKRRILNLN